MSRRKTFKVFDAWCSGHYFSTSIRFLTWVFSDRNVARRVRTILLSRNAPDSLDLTDIPPASQSWYVYFKRYYQGWALDETAIMTRVFNRFNNVSNMHIEINDSRNLCNLDQGISLIQAAWTSFSPRLYSLTISAPLDIISAIIPTSPTFTFLEHLSLTLFAPPMCDDSTLSDSLAAHIKGFINRHRQTLRSLDLSGRILKYTVPLVAKIDLGALLVCLDNILHLTSLAFNSTPSIDPTAVTRFLDLHSKRLHNLDITMAAFDSSSREIPPTDPFLRHIQVPIPDLNTLSLDFVDFAQCGWAVPTADVLQDYIGQYSSSLTSFKLLRAMLSRKHALSLFDPKGCFKSAADLRHMVIGLESLTPEILDLISVTLPNLYELEVRFHAFRGQGDRDLPNEKGEQEVSSRFRISKHF